MKCRLRALEPADIDLMLTWENDETMWCNADTLAPLSRRQVEEYIYTYDADPFRATQLRLVLETDGLSVGLVDLYNISQLHSHAFCGIYIAPEYRKSGFGKIGIELLCKYSGQRLGLCNLAADIVSNNKASIALFKSCGFRHCGTLAGWRRINNEKVDMEIYLRNLT